MLVLALAGLRRLGSDEARPAEVLEVEVVVPQVAQGTLAVECRADDRATRGLLAAPRQVETLVGQLDEWVGGERSWFHDLVARGPEGQRAELDAEIARTEAGGSPPLDTVALLDRYQHFEGTARELLADFREVEENFRALDRGAREQIAAWDGAKGELLEQLVGDRHAIAASDQGRSFQAFHDFLLSRTRQDELGVLLYGHDRNAYWYGSHLSLEQARQLAPYQNATGLHVTSAVLAGMVWALENPKEGIVEADEMDFDRLLEIQTPYLGPVKGYYTDWTPLEGRPGLFPEELDTSDPWQFKNILVQGW